MRWCTSTWTASGHWCGDMVEHDTEPPKLTADDGRRAWNAYAAAWEAEHGDAYYLLVMRHDETTGESEIVDIMEIAP